MKTRLPRVVLCVGFVVGALGAAYLAGLSQRIVQHEAAAADAAAKKLAEEARAEANYKPPPKLSRDEAWQKILDGLQKGEDINLLYGSYLSNVLNNVDVSDKPFLLEQLAKLPQSMERDTLLYDFFDDLQRTDPATALSLVGLIADPRRRGEMTNEIFGSLARQVPDLARQELAKLSPGPQALGAFKSVYEVLIIEGIDVTENDGPNPFSDLGQKTSDQNPIEGAREVADEAFNLPAGPNRTAALLGVVESWGAGGNHYPALLDWAGGLPPADSGVLKQALLDTGAQQPQLAAQYLDNLDDASARNEVILKIAGGMVAGTPDADDPDSADPAAEPDQNTALDRAGAALDWLNQVATGDTYDQAAQNIFNNLGAFDADPQTVENLLDKVNQPNVRDSVIAQVAYNWGEDDPQAALAWAQALPATDATARQDALNSIVSGWYEDDPAPALAFVQNAADPSLFSAAEFEIALDLDEPEGQSAAALAFAQSMPTGEDKNHALRTILWNIADNDFPTAWQDALNLPADSSRDAAMSSLIPYETDNDPAKAAGLIGQLTDASAQTEAAKSLAADWAQTDPSAATAWVNSLPPGAPRDAATAQLVSSQMSADPAAALALANSITDPQAQAAQVQTVQLASQINQLPPGGQRDNDITQLLPVEMQTDPEGALAWAGTISNPQVRSDQLQAAFVAAGVSWGHLSYSPTDQSDEARAFHQLTDVQQATIQQKIGAANAAKKAAK